MISRLSASENLETRNRQEYNAGLGIIINSQSLSRSMLKIVETCRLRQVVTPVLHRHGFDSTTQQMCDIRVHMPTLSGGVRCAEICPNSPESTP
jgi:hypothetical protein